MVNLTELGLYLYANNIEIFIDGNNLKKNIIDHLLHLKKFQFDIRSIIYVLDQAVYLPSNEEIEKTFRNFMNNKVISCVDYFPKKDTGQCHIYSYPYTMTHYRGITNNFPGGSFKYVREVTLFDEHPFEHEFFLRISQSFPYLKVLSINNRVPQNHKQCRTSNDDNQECSMIKYCHLIELSLPCIHTDYIEQFLDHTKTCISNNVSLFVDYYLLRKVTGNFKRNHLRVNCSKLTNLHLLGEFQIPNHFNV
jgi:hypothetical protein